MRHSSFVCEITGRDLRKVFPQGLLRCTLRSVFGAKGYTSITVGEPHS